MISIQTSEKKDFQVSLPSNPSTGYAWELHGELPLGLKLVGNELKMPEARPDAPMAMGAGGQDIWTFQAVEKGTFRFQMKYTSPFSEGSPDIEEIEVVID